LYLQNVLFFSNCWHVKYWHEQSIKHTYNMGQASFGSRKGLLMSPGVTRMLMVYSLITLMRSYDH
jgi:hypothetical protein